MLPAAIMNQVRALKSRNVLRRQREIELTPELITTVAALVARGLCPSAACRCVCVPHAVLTSWRAAAALGGKSNHALRCNELVHALGIAEQQCALRTRERVERLADEGSVPAALALLAIDERRSQRADERGGWDDTTPQESPKSPPDRRVWVHIAAPPPQTFTVENLA